MTMLITGGNGQLGTEMWHLLEEKGIDYVVKNSKELDITNVEQVNRTIEELQPTVIFHCAAYTAVDAAEDESKELNWQVNVQGTENIAQAAEKVGAVFVYISTDYVFNGEHLEPYQADENVDPQNEYGRAKLAGEQAVQKICSQYYIIRTSWVFGKYGKNFVFTMQNLAKQHKTITVVDDQIGRPTWTRSLAEFMLFIVEKQAAFGIYHFSNNGTCSWYEFAKEILKNELTIVEPVDSSKFPQKAKRPHYSILDLSKSEALGFEIISWQAALAKMLHH